MARTGWGHFSLQILFGLVGPCVQVRSRSYKPVNKLIQLPAKTMWLYSAKLNPHNIPGHGISWLCARWRHTHTHLKGPLGTSTTVQFVVATFWKQLEFPPAEEWRKPPGYTPPMARREREKMAVTHHPAGPANAMRGRSEARHRVHV